MSVLLYVKPNKTNNMNCQNCGKQITCGCQKKIASNGKQVCSSCVGNYEQTLKINKAQQNV